MKRLSLVLGMLVVLAGFGYAGEIYFGQTTNCIDIYNVGGGTMTTAFLTVGASSITFVTAGGDNPGTSSVDFMYDTANDTVGELVTAINALKSATTAGVGAGWVASLSQGSYDGNVSASMTIVGATQCLTEKNKKTLAIDAAGVKGISYVIPNGTNQSIYLSNLVGNATFASGSCPLTIYDGSSTSNTKIRGELSAATTVDKAYGFNVIKGSQGQAMRIDSIVTVVPMTNGYLNFSYEIKN